MNESSTIFSYFGRYDSIEWQCNNATVWLSLCNLVQWACCVAAGLSSFIHPCIIVLQVFMLLLLLTLTNIPIYSEHFGSFWEITLTRILKNKTKTTHTTMSIKVQNQGIFKWILNLIGIVVFVVFALYSRILISRMYMQLYFAETRLAFF